MPEDSEIIDIAARTIEQSLIGVLSTVDGQGRPRSRYMAAVADDHQLQYLFALTATETRKVHEIRDRPGVCWLFADGDYEHVVRLSGEARFTSTAELPLSIWNRLIDVTAPYVASDLREKDHYAFHALVTRVQTLELLAPSLDLRSPRTIDLEHRE